MARDMSDNSANYHFDVIHEDDATLPQEQFINYWNQHYFGEVAVSKGLTKAPVHWRLILRDDQGMASHVALTEMNIEMNGQPTKCGAVGGLFTPLQLQGRGYGSALTSRAEAFIFDRLELSMGILFCLPELVPFYAKRGWSLVDQPVTLEQKNGVVTWGAAVMIVSADRAQKGHHSIHIPMGGPADETVE